MNRTTQAPALHDVYAPVPLAEPTNWLLILAGIAVLLLIAIAAIFLLQKMRGRKKIIPEIPPHEIALSQLTLARQYIETGDILGYAGRVSEILRIYIEQRFTIQTTRQTTREFLDIITRESPHALLCEHRASLASCLELFDLAKYAHKSTFTKSMEAIDEEIRIFINATKMAEEA